MTVKNELVYRVHTTRKGVKVMHYDGRGLRDNLFAKRHTTYFYGDDAEEKAHDYAKRKAEDKEDARVVPLGESL